MSRPLSINERALKLPAASALRTLDLSLGAGPARRQARKLAGAAQQPARLARRAVAARGARRVGVAGAVAVPAEARVLGRPRADARRGLVAREGLPEAEDVRAPVGTLGRLRERRGSNAGQNRCRPRDSSSGADPLEHFSTRDLVLRHPYLLLGRIEPRIVDSDSPYLPRPMYLSYA